MDQTRPSRVNRAVWPSTSLRTARRVSRVGKREPLDVAELVRDNENLREQRRAVGEVLRAVAVIRTCVIELR